jgi:hypothetical protein
MDAILERKELGVVGGLIRSQDISIELEHLGFRLADVQLEFISVRTPYDPVEELAVLDLPRFAVE